MNWIQRESQKVLTGLRKDQNLLEGYQLKRQIMKEIRQKEVK